MPPTRFVNLVAARARFGDRVDRLAPYLDRTDTIADDVVATIEEIGHAQGWAMISRALRSGIAAVPNAPASVRALFAQIDDVPAFVDWQVLDVGSDFQARTGVLGGLALATKSIVHGYASPAGNKPLVFSGRLTGREAARRLNETSRFVQAVTQRGGMRRFSEGFAIAVKVRLMHASVRRLILQSGRWDARAWGAPINQHDMSVTTILFSLAVLEGVRQLGLETTNDESESFLQLWRYVGVVMGGAPELIPASEHEAKRLAELILATQAPPDDDARTLTRALIDSGLGVNDPAQNKLIRRRRRIGEAVARELLGEPLATQLGLRASRWDAMVPVLRASVRAAEAVRVRVPGMTERAIENGRRYWKRVVEIGLAGASADFGLARSLAVSAAE
jgi:hypothetical protein